MDKRDLRDYITPLQRWWWLLLAASVVAVLSNQLTVRSQPQMHQSTATVMVGNSINDPNPLRFTPVVTDQIIKTYTDYSALPSVRDTTKAALGMTSLPKFTIRAVKDTQLMEIRVVDTDPRRAQRVATELIRQLILMSPTDTQEQERDALIDDELDALQVDIIATKAAIALRQEKLASLFSSREIADARSQLNALEAKLRSQRASYATLLTSSQRQDVNSITVIEPALAGIPLARQSSFTILLAAITGLSLAVAGAYLIETLDNTIRNTDEVKLRLGLETLTAVPSLDGELKFSPVYMMEHSQAPQAEAFRILRTNLRFAAVVRPVQTVAVTSSLPGEGKSMVSANLAVALAQSGAKVILIDADLHRPRQHRIFGLVNNMGLTSALLSEEADARQYLRRTPLPTLHVLTSGPLPPNAAELVGSQRMQRMLTLLRQHADVILIDCPPCAVVADAAVISTLIDGVIMVVEVGRTKRDIAWRAVDTLRQVDAHMVGVVLNRMPHRSSGNYYSYYTYDRQSYHRVDDIAETTPTVHLDPFTPPFRRGDAMGRAQGQNGRQPLIHSSGSDACAFDHDVAPAINQPMAPEQEELTRNKPVD